MMNYRINAAGSVFIIQYVDPEYVYIDSLWEDAAAYVAIKGP